MNEIEKTLIADLQQIAHDLIKAHGLSFNSVGPSTALHRWLDFRLRCIPAQPRSVKISRVLLCKQLPKEVQRAYDELKICFKKGEDVTPYMSRSLFKNSVNHKDRTKRTDAMWAEWGIQHFHLTTDPENERADWLLFAKVDGEQALFIDVRRHSEHDLWTQAEICQTLLNAWPQQSGLKSIETANRPSCSFRPKQPTAKQLKKLRKEGINHAFAHKGHYFFLPCSGLTTAATSLRSSWCYVNIVHWVRQMARELEKESCPLRVELAQRGISQPNFHLKSVNNRLVIACDEKPSEVWASNKSENDCLGWIESMVLPDRPMPINPYQKKAA